MKGKVKQSEKLNRLLLIFAVVWLQSFLTFCYAGTDETKPAFKKVVIIVLENEKLSEAIAQPYLAKIAKQGALLNNYHGITHPAQPNYIAMVAGDTLGVKNDHVITLNKSNIVDLLEAKGKSWKVYAEDYPGKCSLSEWSRHYAKKHNVLISFKNIQENVKRCERIVGAQDFDKDIKAKMLPEFSLFIPNQNNNGHDPGIKQANKWLSKFLDPYLNDAELMSDTLFVVTFDEDDYSGKENKIYTVFLGGGVIPGVVSDTRYDHYSLLRTVEETFDLGTLERNDAKAKPILGIWGEQIHQTPAGKT
jgi:hypothetical protein